MHLFNGERTLWVRHFMALTAFFCLLLYLVHPKNHYFSDVLGGCHLDEKLESQNGVMLNVFSACCNVNVNFL